jgi:putative methionine-R-sulfoxide reductase with GAF domain
MMPTSPGTAARAPRLWLRRIARHYFYPWVQVLVTVALAILSWRFGVDARFAAVWLFVAFTCLLIEDLYTVRSWLNRAAAYLDGDYSPPTPAPDTLEYYTSYTPPLWFERRVNWRWWASLALLVATWGYAVLFPGWAVVQLDPTARALLALSLLLFAVVPFGVTLVSPVAYSRVHGSYVSSALLALSVVVAYLSVAGLTRDRPDGIIIATVIGLTYGSIFVAQRLWAGERVYNDVLRELSIAFLAWPPHEANLQVAAALIGERFNYERVFLLLPTQKGDQLRIAAAHLQTHTLIDQRVPIDGSLTGKAYVTRRPVAWNDVDRCPYYYSALLTDTRAEIAVPIIHQDTVYAILDVQSVGPNVFTEKDTRVLETIGHMLGASMATQRREEFYSAAAELWERLDATTMGFPNEQSAFEFVSEFVAEKLNTALIVYYPLSLTGWPVAAPFIYVSPTEGAPPHSPAQADLNWLLARLEGWTPVYYEEPDLPENLPTWATAAPVRSLCFLPVGHRHERMGALFLCFSRPQGFHATFRFTVRSLSQVLAELTAEVRYRDIFSRGFGRPELNVHNLINRYGFKVGSVRARARLLLDRDGPNDYTLMDCPLQELVGDVERAFRDISLAESSFAPEFWGMSLGQQLDRYGCSLLGNSAGPKPRLVHHIEPRIDHESRWLRLALYRVITEAANNAVIHGHATVVRASVQRLPAEIKVTVDNEGNAPLPENARRQASRFGIFSLLEECERQLGAAVTIEPSGSGTRITLSIPALPFS